MAIVVLILVALLAFGLLKGMVRHSHAKAMTARRVAREHVASSVDLNKVSLPSWFPSDRATAAQLFEQIEDGLRSGGIETDKAKAMASHPMIRASGLAFAAGYEAAGMGKISQLAAVGTDFEAGAAGVETRFDDLRAREAEAISRFTPD